MYYFEVKVQYTILDGNSLKHSFMVNAASFSDAEHKVVEEIASYSSKYEVLAIKILKVFNLVNINIDKEHIYVCKVKLITVQDNGRETFKPVNIYVSADNLTEAKTAINKEISNLDAELVAVVETKMVGYIS